MLNLTMSLGKKRMVALVVCGFVLSVNSQANAQKLTNDMSCEQAKDTFEDRGRLLTRSRLGGVMKVYGGDPIRGAEIDEECSVRHVITRDRRSCPVSINCPD